MNQQAQFDTLTAEWIEKLKAEGYQEVAVHPTAPNTEFPKHTHEKMTVHVILEGELTTEDETNGIKIWKPSDKFEIPAGTTHTAKCGPNGCTFIVGWK